SLMRPKTRDRARTATAGSALALGLVPAMVSAAMTAVDLATQARLRHAVRWVITAACVSSSPPRPGRSPRGGDQQGQNRQTGTSSTGKFARPARKNSISVADRAKPTGVAQSGKLLTKFIDLGPRPDLVVSERWPAPAAIFIELIALDHPDRSRYRREADCLRRRGSWLVAGDRYPRYRTSVRHRLRHPPQQVKLRRLGQGPQCRESLSQSSLPQEANQACGSCRQ